MARNSTFPDGDDLDHAGPRTVIVGPVNGPVNTGPGAQINGSGNVFILGTDDD